MAAQGLDQVMAFLTDHGFAGTASALRDDVLARTAAGDESHAAALDPHLPPLRMPASAVGAGAGAGTPAPASPDSSSGSASSSAFVSMRSTPSGTQARGFFVASFKPSPPCFPWAYHTISICAPIFPRLWLPGANSALMIGLEYVFFCGDELYNIIDLRFRRRVVKPLRHLNFRLCAWFSV
jgi:hypothetical protein